MPTSLLFCSLAMATAFCSLAMATAMAIAMARR